MLNILQIAMNCYDEDPALDSDVLGPMAALPAAIRRARRRAAGSPWQLRAIAAAGARGPAKTSTQGWVVKRH